MLPASLLEAISARPRGRVAIVTGAGCSVEKPTELPTAKTVALEAHGRLVADGVLNAGECANPADLSCVADAVFAKTGEQTPLVQRMRPQAFRTAEPNEGYLLAAALLREQAIICLMTLNFDYAIAVALSQLGAKDTVAVIHGPEDHGQISAINVIFLHRSALSPFENWILRTAALDAWHGRWEEVVAGRVLSSPVTVFAGLGTPSGVLLETTHKVRTAIPGGTAIYQVDPTDREQADFFAQLNIPAESYIQLPWGQFMRELSERLLLEHKMELQHRCEAMVATEGLEQENTEALCASLVNLGLLSSGKLRARWLLEATAYVPHLGLELSWIANLILAIALIQRKTGTRANLREDGIVDFYRGDKIVTAMIIGHGRGSKRWLSIEPTLHTLAHEHQYRRPHALRAVVAGVQGPRQPEVSPPANIVPTSDPLSILPKGIALRITDVDELRRSDAALNALVNDEP